MKYRPEIDGLRTIAVVPVVLFHAGFKNLSGGFIGVDIFFVISGFLITTILINELQAGKFSIINFYERRARRILPALSVVVLLTTLAALILMPSTLFKAYSQSVVSVGTFLSNFYFYLTSGYFSTAAEEKPLLHTWSLAVEEQYYVFFPLLLMVLWKFGAKVITAVIAAILLFSLGLNVYLMHNGAFDFSFYSIFTRAWELLVGSILAIYVVYKGYATKAWINQVLSVLGLLMIVYAYLFITKQDAHPGLITLIPVLGTALVIFAANQNNLVGKLLSTKLFVAIGLISYSLYLWHQPLFAFIKMKTFGSTESILLIVAVVATLVLSIWSYHYVEKPFRNKNRFDAKRIFRWSGVALSLMCVLGLAGHVLNGVPQRFINAPEFVAGKASPYRDSCHTSGLDYIKPAEACEYGGETINWAVFGDSHAIEPAYALAMLLKTRNEGVKHFSFSGCPPSVNYESSVLGCTQWTNQVLAYIEYSDNLTHVYLGYRYSSFLFGNQLNYFPEVPNRAPPAIKIGQQQISDPDLVTEQYWQDLKLIIERLLNAGKRVYLQLPVPELPMHIFKLTSPKSVFQNETLMDPNKAMPLNYHHKRNEFILDKINRSEILDQIALVDPVPKFCNAHFCSAVIDGKMMYFDDNHLSVEGAMWLLHANPSLNLTQLSVQ